MNQEEFIIKDISTELYREYIMTGKVYRIDNPIQLWLRSGSKFHRVVDSSGVAHTVPAPGDLNCYAVRWKTTNPNVPVNF